MALNNCLLMVSERVFFKTHKLKAFTLAEVLITLVIIGVIAAMTIPTLMNKTDNHEYVSKLKKAYSVMSAATNSLIAEQGSPNASLGGWSSSTESLLNAYKSKLAHTDECIGSSCIGSYKTLTNANKSLSSVNPSKLVLNDGTFIYFYMYDNNLTCSRSSNGTNNYCGGVMIDINGEKKPNKIGRDLFYFAIKENGLFPFGCDSDGYCNGPNSTVGYGCSCKVIRENAMNY